MRNKKIICLFMAVSIVIPCEQFYKQSSDNSTYAWGNAVTKTEISKKTTNEIATSENTTNKIATNKNVNNKKVVRKTITEARAGEESSFAETTSLVEATSVAETTSLVEATSVAETTSEVEATSVAETTSAVEATSVAETTSTVEATSVAETTSAVETTSVAETTSAVETTSIAVTTTPEVTTVFVGDTKIDTVARKRTSKKIQIILTKVPNATMYEIEISKTPDFDEILFSNNVVDLKETKAGVINATFTSKNFKKQGVLYIRARAYIGMTPGHWTEGERVKLIKKSLDLIKYVKKRIGCPYLYGYKQPYEWNSFCTKKEYKQLKKRWGNAVWASDKKRCVGKTPADCSGLISAYTEFEKGSIPYKEQAVKKWKIRKKSGRLNIAKMKRIPIGTAVWQEGHIGVFVGWIGNVPYYIAEDGSAYGCRLHPLADSGFTHALIISDVEYSIVENYDVKVKSTTKFYKNASTAKTTYAWYKKGSTLTIVAEKNGRGLVRESSLKQNLWVDLKTVKKKK